MHVSDVWVHLPCTSATMANRAAAVKESMSRHDALKLIDLQERLRTASQHAQEMEKDLRKQMQDVLDKLALERDSW